MAIEIGDKDPLYFAARGVCLRKMRRYAEALEDLSIAIEMDPAEVSHWFNRGLVNFEREDLSRAEADFSRACSNDTGIGTATGKYAYRALYNRANCRRRMGLYGMAINDLQDAVKMEPGNPAANDALGLVMCDVGDFEEALRAFGRALDAAPGHWMFLTHRGLSLYHLGRLEEAKSDLDLAVRIVSRDRTVLERQVPVGGETVVIAFSEETEPQFHRANVLLAQGNLTEAGSDIAAAVAGALHAVRDAADVKMGTKPVQPASSFHEARGVGGQEESDGVEGATVPFAAAESLQAKRPPQEFIGREAAAVGRGPSPKGRQSQEGEAAAEAASGSDGMEASSAAGEGSGDAPMVIPLPTEAELAAAVASSAESLGALTRRLHSAGLILQASTAWAAAERCFAAAAAVSPGHLASRYHRALMLHVLGWHASADRELSEVMDRAAEAAEASSRSTLPGSEGGVSLDAPMRRPAARRKLLEARALVRQALGHHEEAVDDFGAALEAMDEQQEMAEQAETVLAAQEAAGAGGLDAADGVERGGRADLTGGHDSAGMATEAGAAAGGGGGPEGVRFSGQLWLTPVAPQVRGECEYHRAVSLLSLHPPQVEEALRALQFAVKSGFDGPETWDKVAAAQLLLGRIKAAISAYSEGLKREPTSHHFLARRAQCKRESGDSASAVEDLTDALTLLEGGAAAEPHIRRSAQTQPGPDAASAVAEAALRKGSKPSAIDSRHAQAVATAKEAGRLLFIRGLCRYDTDEFGPALEDFEMALGTPVQSSVRAAIHYAAGIAQANSDEYDLAVLAFEHSLTEEGDEPSGEEQLQRLHELAKSFQMLDRHEDAITYFDQVIGMNPHNGKPLSFFW
jgi:tetratricopeptide (TPR) repeat protein